MDWIRVSPKFTCRRPNCPPQCNGIGRWSLCEVTRVRWSHEGGALMMAWESESKSYSVAPNALWSHGLYRLPGCSVHGILQARILDWIALSFSRGSSQNRDWTQVSHIAGRFFTIWMTREAPQCGMSVLIRRGRERSFSSLCEHWGDLQQNPIMPSPWSQTSSLQNCGEISHKSMGLPWCLS